MGRGFARRRPFDFDFETIMRGEGGAVKRSQWWQGTTGGVTEHTKMADTLGSFVRPGDNLTLKPLPLRRPPTTRRRLSHHPPHTHAQRHAAVNGSYIPQVSDTIRRLLQLYVSLSLRRALSERTMCIRRQRWWWSENGPPSCCCRMLCERRLPVAAIAHSSRIYTCTHTHVYIYIYNVYDRWVWDPQTCGAHIREQAGERSTAVGWSFTTFGAPACIYSYIVLYTYIYICI